LTTLSANSVNSRCERSPQATVIPASDRCRIS
jgi:hypothetical protein